MKIKLELDKLQVESFVAGGVSGEGTVRGYTGGVLGGTCGCGGGVQCQDSLDSCGAGGTNIGCQNSAFPCQSVNACHTDACHDISKEYPYICGEVSWPNCSFKCTNVLGCTTPDMGC